LRRQSSQIPPSVGLKGVGFFSGVLAHGVAEQGISASMRARRSRSQHALRWERGRPARNPDHARKKPTPLSLRRFPPLREGNRAGGTCGRGLSTTMLREGDRAGVRFPLRAGGTCRRGLSTTMLREGNRAGVRFPMRAGGTCRRGLSTTILRTLVRRLVEDPLSELEKDSTT
jgi:hypothetical protein